MAMHTQPHRQVARSARHCIQVGVRTVRGCSGHSSSCALAANRAQHSGTRETLKANPRWVLFAVQLTHAPCLATSGGKKGAGGTAPTALELWQSVEQIDENVAMCHEFLNNFQTRMAEARNPRCPPRPVHRRRSRSPRPTVFAQPRDSIRDCQNPMARGVACAASCCEHALLPCPCFAGHGGRESCPGVGRPRALTPTEAAI